jgi:hypothetical protein
MNLNTHCCIMLDQIVEQILMGNNGVRKEPNS